MNIITQLVTLTLSLLLVNADNDQYCTNLYKDFKHKCTSSIITIRSCCELKTFLPEYAPSGVYKMIKGKFASPADVYCDTTTDGGGWIVIQRNRNNSQLSFNKNWVEYKDGFGDLNKDFWYGLEAIHTLTQNGQWEMRVDYQALGLSNSWYYLYYNQFSVGSASQEYPLTIGGMVWGGNLFAKSRTLTLNGMKFSTQDNDNDRRSGGSCTASYQNSGWWYNDCCSININTQPPVVSSQVLFTEMKIRPTQCTTH